MLARRAWVFRKPNASFQKKRACDRPPPSENPVPGQKAARARVESLYDLRHPDAAVATLHPRMTSKSILIIEDDPTMAYLLRYVLEREGYAVEHRSDGRQGWDYLSQQGAADLVVADVMLPYIDGFELLKSMREDSRWQHTPVVLLTAREQELDVTRAFDLGADDYVKKPFSPIELLARIRRQLARAERAAG